MANLILSFIPEYNKKKEDFKKKMEDKIRYQIFILLFEKKKYRNRNH